MFSVPLSYSSNCYVQREAKCRYGTLSHNLSLYMGKLIWILQRGDSIDSNDTTKCREGDVDTAVHWSPRNRDYCTNGFAVYNVTRD
jgi:hypothetical protein